MPDPAPIASALCRELSAVDGAPPEWLLLVPAGEFTGRDGRAWVNDRPEAIVSAHNRAAVDLPVDWEHSTEHRAPKGEEAPAAGWISAMEIRGGAVWGRVTWTERAHNQIRAREYRYYSAAFDFTRSSRRVVRMTSVGLTNRPNLHVTALNRQETPPMPLSKIIAAALALAETATDADAAAAVEALKSDRQTALNRAEAPPLERFVPRADHDAALARALNAEQALAADRTARLEGEIETAINTALEQKKITPATADYHRAMCRQAGGLEQFQKYTEAAPAVLSDKGADGKPPEGEEAALNAEQAVIAKAFGNSAEDLAKHAPAV